MARCTETGLSCSYMYGKRWCRCVTCKAYKRAATARHAEANRARSKRWHAANKDKMKEYHIRNPRPPEKVAASKFKITVEEYKRYMDASGGKCAICKSEVSAGIGVGRRLHLDHDHKTGKIRGVLCGSCNVGLGHFYDSIEALEQAILYLKESQSNGDVYGN